MQIRTPSSRNSTESAGGPQKEKAIEIFLNGLYLMPATTGFYPEVKPKDSHTLSHAAQSALRGYCRNNRGYGCFPHLSKSTLPRLGLPGAYIVKSVLMHSPSPQIVKESKTLCQPSGASSRSGASGALLSHSSSSSAIGARKYRLSTRSRKCSRKTRHRASRGGLILTAAMTYPIASTICCEMRLDSTEPGWVFSRRA
jgi:hypothetical protein